jgi:VWFA-related protein
MTPRARSLAIAALGCGAAMSGLLRASAPPQQTPTFRAATDAVVVNVSVRDGLKVPLGLGLSDFEVLDDGVPQEITDVSYGKVPIDVTVAVDVSTSETGAPLARLKRGVLQFVSDLAPDERLKLVAFNHDVRQVVDFTADRTAVASAVGRLTAGGGTSVFDTLATAMIAPADSARRQLVTIFTDGGDGLSTTEAGELLETGRRSSATVSVVIPRTSLSTQMRPALPAAGRGAMPQVGMPTASPPVRRPESPLVEDVRLIDDLVALTGGRLIIDRGPPADLGSSFRTALDALRASYVLYFTPRGVTKTGFHTLTVTLPGHAKFTVSARSGYFGG